MKTRKRNWLPGLFAILFLIGIPVWFFTGTEQTIVDTPWENMPQRPAHVDHKDLYDDLGDLTTGRDVTAACLTCHEEAAEQVMHTAHWRWEAEPVAIEGREGLFATGKKNTINNFCIGIQGNWASCTACHAGYGWEDETFDFEDRGNIDCLVCHDSTGTYSKGKAGLPLEGIDLLAVAKSVAIPTRQNCGGCHFRGGGGNAVKHGDLDESLYYPSAEIDVHMGRFDFQCVDCHQTTDHVIGGRSISVSVDKKNQIACTDCHNPKLHTDERLNAHTDTLACQTCHIPEVAVKQATKTHWDWSAAGDDSREEDVHQYMKIKGSFIYERNLRPEYRWYNGLAERYLMGDSINANGSTLMNPPKGDIRDADARIWPFKIHRAKQPYDVDKQYLMTPVTSGEGGYWKSFDWDQALRLGAEITGLEYSGNYDFAATEMFWPQTHMVAPKNRALQCQACHAEGGRMDWEALGYDGDPIKQGSQTRKRTVAGQRGADHE
jgi:octaheme c-type cytochrome (tetrathionate reductase family)